MEKELKPTPHLIKRRKRLGFSKAKFAGFLNQAWRHGLRMSDLKKKRYKILYEYLKDKIKPGYYPIVYNGYVLICSRFTHYGITLIQLPEEYREILSNSNLGGKPNGKRCVNSSSQKAEDGQEYSSENSE